MHHRLADLPGYFGGGGDSGGHLCPDCLYPVAGSGHHQRAQCCPWQCNCAGGSPGNPAVAVLIFLVAFLVLGFLFEGGIVRPILHKPPETILMASIVTTFGLALA